MVGGNAAAPADKRRYGLPPLKHLRAIMDASGYTRADLAHRSGLSYPTLTRVIEGKERVRASTAEKVARAVGVPVKALYDDLAYAELSGRVKLPPVVAGNEYGYPGEHANEGGDAALKGGFGEGESASGEGFDRHDKQYVILHRDEWLALHETLSTVSGRLDAIEEAVGELATRPIAQFDVDIHVKERKGT